MASDLISNGELILSGEVVDDAWVGFMWEEDVFFSPGMVRKALAGLGEGRVTVRINSNGGHAAAGEQIRTMLASHPGGCRIIVEGQAASAASLILMAGVERLMSAGSYIMIHDPSGCVCGTEDETRRAADALAVLASTYATVYAAVSGKSAQDVRTIMKAETWLGPDAAIAEGFATGIAPEALAMPAAASLEAAQSAFMASHAGLRRRLSQHNTNHPSGRANRPANEPAAARGNQREEGVMPEDQQNSAAPANAAAGTTPAPAAPAATPPAPLDPATGTPAPAQMRGQSADDIRMAERARMRAIRDMAAPFVTSGRLMQADVDALIDEGVSADAAGARFMASMADAESPTRTGGPRTAITRDETETRMEGMVAAMMGQSDGPAQEYRGLRVRNLAMALAGPSRGYNDSETIRRGMRSTTMMGGAYGISDFAHITTEVMNRSLQAAYQRRAATWQMVTGQPLTATDFRELHSVRFGGDFSLKPVQENGEYQSAVLADEAEGLKVERRGRTIKLTFEAVINDDMGAFQRIPMEFAMAARTMENSMVWALIRTNARLKSDNKALFHADHGNLGAAAAISAASVAVARRSMWEQRAFGTSDKDDFMQVEPNRLIVPPALELVALQFTTVTTPASDGETNPYKSTLQPAVVPNLGAAAGGSDSAWYLVSSDLPPVAHAYLEGYSAPTVQTIEGMNPDAVTMNARHIFGAALAEYRGTYKNPGQ